MSLQLAHCLYHPLGSCHKTYTPSGHGISFRHTVDYHAAVAHAFELCYRVYFAHIVDVLIYLIGEYHHIFVLGKHIGKGFEFLLGVDGAGGVRRRAEHHEAGAIGDGVFELLGRNLEVLLVVGKEFHCHALGELHHFHIAHPCRGGDNHLIALINQCKHHIAEFLLCSVAHHYLVGGIVQTVFAFELFADGFAKRQISGHRCIE